MKKGTRLAIFGRGIADYVKGGGGSGAVLEIKGEMRVPYELIVEERSKEYVNIPVIYWVTLWNGIPRADIKLTLENRAKDHRIRLHIPTGFKTDKILSQGHLAVLERPIERAKEVERWFQPPTQLLPCREWVAAEDGKQGLAVALKGMYDYEAITDAVTGAADIYITLLRSIGMMGRLNMITREGGASDAVKTPGAQCMGEHMMEWSYIPYEVSEEEKAPFLSLAQGFLYPSVTHAVRSVAVSEKLDSFMPAFSWENKNIQFSTFKKCMDRNGYILRFYENQGKKTNVNLKINGFDKAWMSNMDEAKKEEVEIAGGEIHLEVLPYKAVSIRFE